METGPRFVVSSKRLEGLRVEQATLVLQVKQVNQCTMSPMDETIMNSVITVT